MSNQPNAEDGKEEGILGQISDQAIASMMEENRVFPVPESFAENATINSFEEYALAAQQEPTRTEM